MSELLEERKELVKILNGLIKNTRKLMVKECEITNDEKSFSEVHDPREFNGD